tara:strand:+ start:261 stop:920 length:660 start_codon:yes stop_codon:yes gene_type:complete
MCEKQANERKARPLYGTKICKKCYYGLTNRRQLAYVIDWFIWMFVASFVTVGLAAFRRSLMTNSPPASVESIRTIIAIISLLLSYLIMPMIFGLKDGFSGMSPGKWICGVQVLDAETHLPISFIQALKRNLILIVPLLPLVIAFTLAKGYRLGDKWANTKVVLRSKRNHLVFTGGLSCEDCQYDLTGNVTGNCPECGRQIPEAAMRQIHEDAQTTMMPA